MIGAKQHRVKSIQNLANEILKLSAPQEELNRFEGKVNTTLQHWDDVCSMVSSNYTYTVKPEDENFHGFCRLLNKPQNF